jgi:hypothetical protein
VGAVIGGSAFYVSVTSDRADRSSSTTMIRRVAESEWSAAAPEPKGEPVRFANPFDSQEVFEFPAGTSESEARDAVAQLLIERAVERQHQFAAQASKTD